MEIEILYRPSYAMAEVSLAASEAIRAEADAMISMSGTVKMTTEKRSKGLLKSFKTAVLGGESFFLNTFTGRSYNITKIVFS